MKNQTREVNQIAKRINVNHKIRAREVRLIDQDGNQVGVVSRQQALETANSAGLDLVEVAPQANPPVCRVMDYGRYKYQQSKKLQEAKKRSASYQIKEVKVRPNTGEHDLEVKLRHIRRFLENGDKVKVSLMFRGREMVYTDQGVDLLNQIVDMTSDIAVVEQQTRREGRQMFMVLAQHK
jgi:translation initiation factor IF-3